MVLLYISSEVFDDGLSLNFHSDEDTKHEDLAILSLNVEYW